MRTSFLIILSSVFYVVQAQIGTLSISEKENINKSQMVAPYDSLENITRHNLPSLVGQKVQIIPQKKLSDLQHAPTLYSSKPSLYCNNSIVVNPDTRLTVFQSKFGSFDNEVFEIVGVDSIFDTNFYTYRTGKFYLIVKNEKYPTNHYLEIALTNDEYDYNKNLKKRGEFYIDYQFVILGYYEKSRNRLIGTKLVNKYPENKFLEGEWIVYNSSTGEPLTSVPKNLIWTIKDITIIDCSNYKGLGYLLSSDSMPECFTRNYLN